MNENKSFNYNYSAKEQDEIQKIRKKYLPPEEDKMAQLRRLDESVAQKACACSIAVGVIGALILGVGMCCCMVWAGAWFVPGIIIGVAGMAIVALAYPVHTYITKKERERIAPAILHLTDELIK